MLKWNNKRYALPLTFTQLFLFRFGHGLIIHIRVSLWWRHNDHDSVSYHQPDECLLNRLFRRTSKKTSKLRVTGLCVGNSPGPVNSPHKGPVTRKMFPFDDVMMSYQGILDFSLFLNHVWYDKDFLSRCIVFWKCCWCIELFKWESFIPYCASLWYLWCSLLLFYIVYLSLVLKWYM